MSEFLSDSTADSERLLALATALRRHGEALAALGAGLAERWIESASARPAQLTQAHAAVRDLGAALAAFDGLDSGAEGPEEPLSGLPNTDAGDVKPPLSAFPTWAPSVYAPKRPLVAGEVRHDQHGYYYCTRAEAAHEDEGHASVGFDLRPHFSTLDQARRYGARVERGDETNH